MNLHSDSTLHSAECVSASSVDFLTDVISGLSQQSKSLPCKYLYDQRGSQLFDQICELDEYYLTRTESAIMQDNSAEIAASIGSEAVVVELGSGSSTKTRILLDSLKEPLAYLPVDISEEHLLAAAEGLRIDYPDLRIEPVVADFTHSFQIPSRYTGCNVHAFFPGSTIGNLTEAEAIELLSGCAHLQKHATGSCSPGMLIGFDLVKDPKVLEAAYNDREGISAQFSLNLLTRMNRELDADFDVAAFKHVAEFNSVDSRIEIYIESLRDQCVSIADQEIEFQLGERILTEYSHKYTPESFVQLAAKAGFRLKQLWTDDRQYFAVADLVAE